MDSAQLACDLGPHLHRYQGFRRAYSGDGDGHGLRHAVAGDDRDWCAPRAPSATTAAPGVGATSGIGSGSLLVGRLTGARGCHHGGQYESGYQEPAEDRRRRCRARSNQHGYRDIGYSTSNDSEMRIVYRVTGSVGLLEPSGIWRRSGPRRTYSSVFQWIRSYATLSIVPRAMCLAICRAWKRPFSMNHRPVR